MTATSTSQTVADLLIEAQAAGFDVARKGEKLSVRGPRSATSIIERLKQHRGAILQFLADGGDRFPSNRGEYANLSPSPPDEDAQSAFPPSEPAPPNDPAFDYTAARLALAARCNAMLPADVELTADDWKRLDVIDSDLAEADGDSWLFAEQADNYAATLQAIIDRERRRETVFVPGHPAADVGWFDPPRLSDPRTNPTGCGAHREQRFWRSVFGPHLICAICHPPATPEVVAENR